MHINRHFAKPYKYKKYKYIENRSMKKNQLQYFLIL